MVPENTTELLASVSANIYFSSWTSEMPWLVQFWYLQPIVVINIFGVRSQWEKRSYWHPFLCGLHRILCILFHHQKKLLLFGLVAVIKQSAFLSSLPHSVMHSGIFKNKIKVELCFLTKQVWILVQECWSMSQSDWWEARPKAQSVLQAIKCKAFLELLQCLLKNKAG